MAKFVTALDNLSVEKLEKMINTFEGRLKDPTLSNTTRKKLLSLREKYIKQKGKTLQIYNANKNKKKYKTSLVGISKSYLSVVKLYQLMNKTTKDVSDKNALVQKLAEHPVENAIAFAGAGAIITGVISTEAGRAAIGKIATVAWKAISAAWQANPVGTIAFTSGALLLGGVILSKTIRKYKQMTAAEVYNAEQEANKGTARDSEFLDVANKDSLVDEAMNDPSVMQYLEDYSLNAYNDPSKIKLAAQVVKEAKQKMAQAEQDVKNAKFENALLSKYGIFKDIDTDIKSRKTTVNFQKTSSYDALLNKAKLVEIQNLEVASGATIAKPTFTTPADAAIVNKIEKLDTEPTFKGPVLVAELAKYDNAEDFASKMGVASIGDETARKQATNYAKAIYNKCVAKRDLAAKTVEYKYDKTTGTLNGKTESDIDKDYDNAILGAALRNGLISNEDLENAFDKSTGKYNYSKLVANLKTSHKDVLDKVLKEISKEAGIEKTA